MVGDLTVRDSRNTQREVTFKVMIYYVSFCKGLNNNKNVLSKYSAFAADHT